MIQWGVLKYVWKLRLENVTITGRAFIPVYIYGHMPMTSLSTHLNYKHCYRFPAPYLCRHAAESVVNVMSMCCDNVTELIWLISLKIQCCLKHTFEFNL